MSGLHEVRSRILADSYTWSITQDWKGIKNRNLGNLLDQSENSLSSDLVHILEKHFDFSIKASLVKDSLPRSLFQMHYLSWKKSISKMTLWQSLYVKKEMRDGTWCLRITTHPPQFRAAHRNSELTSLRCRVYQTFILLLWNVFQLMYQIKLRNIWNPNPGTFM